MESIFTNKGIHINGLPHLSPKEALACCDGGAIIVDVREEFMSHIKTFDVPHIIISPLKKLSAGIKELPQDKALIFADATGVKSKPAMEFAFENGLKNIANLAGGLVEWERLGMPTITYQKLLVGGKNRCEFVDKNDIKK